MLTAISARARVSKRRANSLVIKTESFDSRCRSFRPFFLTLAVVVLYCWCPSNGARTKPETESNTEKESMSTNTNKRKRATRQEMIERLEAKLAKLQAQAEGSFTPDAETLTVKRLRSALRKRRTLLHRAEVMVNGRPGTEKSPATNGIDEKIENARKRLADLEQSKRNAEERIAALPFDIERLESLLEQSETGAEVEFPTDLFPIGGEATETEVEVAAGEPEESDD